MVAAELSFWRAYLTTLLHCFKPRNKSPLGTRSRLSALPWRGPLGFMTWPLASFPLRGPRAFQLRFRVCSADLLLFFVSRRTPFSTLENFCLFFSIQLASQLRFQVFSDPVDCFPFCGLVIPHFIEWGFLLQSSSLTRISFLCLWYTLSWVTGGQAPLLTFVSLGTVIHALWLVEWIISSQRLLQSHPCITAERCSGRMPGLFFLWDAHLSHQLSFRPYRNRTSEHLLVWQLTLNIPAIWVFIFIICILIFKFIISLKNILMDLWHHASCCVEVTDWLTVWISALFSDMSALIMSVFFFKCSTRISMVIFFFPN